MMRRNLVALTGLSIATLLAACGGSGDFTSGGLDGPIGSGSNPGGNAVAAVASISFTQPIQTAIEDRQNGDYRLRGKVDVIDRDGRAVPDGTSIELILLDTVILQDSTGAVEATALDVLRRSGSSLITVRCDPQVSNEASNCQQATSSFSSTVIRSHSVRAIQPGDFVIMRNADAVDRFRRVLSVDGPEALRLDRPLSRAYSGLAIWVGTAASGFSAAGFDPATSTLTQGRVATVQGEGEIRVTYPANVQSLRYGCFGYGDSGAASTVDLRDSVPQSRQVLLAATAANGVTAVDVGRFCAAAIGGGTVEPDVNTVTLQPSSQQTVGLTFRDGGQQIRLAYEPFNCIRTTGPSALSISFPNPQRASVAGGAAITLIRDASDTEGQNSATVECFGSDRAARATITVNLPTPPEPE